MPSRLVVLAGSETDRDFPLEDEVLRLGTDPGCAVHLPGTDLPGHAATLEFRDGGFLLHNRCPADLVLDGKPLPMREFAPWLPGKTLEFPDGLVLQLVVEGDPRPTRNQVVPAAPMVYPEIPPEPPPAADEDDEDKSAPLDDGKKAKKWGQLVVIVGCALLGVYLLMFDTPAETGKGERDPRKEFEEVVQVLVVRKDDPTAASLRRMLQSARIAELRKEAQTAQDHYGAVRDRLLSLGDLEDPAVPEEYRKVWEFIKTRMKPVPLTDF